MPVSVLPEATEEELTALVISGVVPVQESAHEWRGYVLINSRRVAMLENWSSL